MAMYRFGQAAMAIGVTEAGLRNWMTRNELDLFDGRPKGGWREFSQNDVLILALAAELVRFKAEVKAAVEAARIALADMNFATFKGMPNVVYFAPYPSGKWEARTDEGLVRHMTGLPSVLKVSVPEVLNAARKRLEAAPA